MPDVRSGDLRPAVDAGARSDLRIALLSVSDQMGGSETVLLETVRQVRTLRRGWQLHLVTPGDGPLSAGARTAGATVHVVPMPRAVAGLGEAAANGPLHSRLLQAGRAAAALPGYERSLARTLGQIRPDVVHSNGFKAHVVSSRWRGQARRLWHLHEYVSHRPMTTRFVRHYADRCDRWVANSASVAEDVRAVAGDRLRHEGAVIPNGVDLTRFARSAPAMDLDALSGFPPAPPGSVRIGLVATFSRWKGHDVFLRAIAQLPADLPVRVYIVGGPVYDTGGSQHTFEDLRAMAGALGCADRVGFAGFQPDAPAVMRALDVVVHASTAPEPFGMVLVEAMAAGCAVVSAAQGGAADIVQTGVNGLVYAPGDSRDLAAAIERLVRDAALRARLGAGGQATASARYDARQFGRAMVGAYERLLEN